MRGRPSTLEPFSPNRSSGVSVMVSWVDIEEATRHCCTWHYFHGVKRGNLRAPQLILARAPTPRQVADIEKAEKEKMRAKCKRIIDHGINCFVNRQLIYNFPEEIFADAGIMAIEHADFDGIERLALVTGDPPSSPHLLLSILSCRNGCM